MLLRVDIKLREESMKTPEREKGQYTIVIKTWSMKALCLSLSSVSYYSNLIEPT